MGLTNVVRAHACVLVCVGVCPCVSVCVRVCPCVSVCVHVLHIWNFHMSCVRMRVHVRVRVRVLVRVCPRVFVYVRV